MAAAGERQRFTTADLVGILDAEPERISPSALLRPVFQDFLLWTSLRSAARRRLLTSRSPRCSSSEFSAARRRRLPRFSATLIEPAIAELLRKHELTLEQVFRRKRGLAGAAAGGTRHADRNQAKTGRGGQRARRRTRRAVEWMQSQDKGLGQSAETAAGKMRYQMNRLRTLAANFQLQREATLTRHANSIFNALYPGGVLQERVHGAAYYFARYGLELAELLSEQAGSCSGHTALWL